MLPIERQVVVITGASSGIGRATARKLADRKARLVLAARDAQALQEVARECRERGAEAIDIPTDVVDEAAVMALRDAAVNQYGRIDIWINDAAVYAMGRFEDMPTDAIRRLFETNVLGVVHGSKAALAQFRKQGQGRLINLGSSAGRAPYAEASAYCASKHAVHGLTEAIRQELLGTRIDVSLIAPATVDTPIFQHAANFTGREVVAMPPIYDPERVARAIISCAERPKRIVAVGATARLMWLNRFLFPGNYERKLPRSVETKHLGRAKREAFRGNLDGPIEPHRVDGGWLRGQNRTGIAVTALLASIVSVIALSLRR